MVHQEGQQEGQQEADLQVALAVANGALERGDYGRVRQLLEPLAEQHAAASKAGAELRLLLATALMGQGQAEAAAHWCRSLNQCLDPELRARGRELLLVLEAPALERPREWSLTLPNLAASAQLESLGAPSASLRRKRVPDPPPPPPPPVGPTRAPLGFATVAALVLVLMVLASLLGGCMDVRTDLQFAGPGRLRITHHLRSSAANPTPWQRRYVETLSHEGFRSQRTSQETILQTAVLPIDQARAALVASFKAAAALGVEPLPEPRLVLRERNWLVGVRQRLWLDLDLEGLAPLPGVDLSLGLEPVRSGAVRRAEPLALLDSADGHLIWPLRLGEANHLELSCWRWSPLGLGAIAIALLLPLVFGLQRLRRQLGFGLPELPA